MTRSSTRAWACLAAGLALLAKPAAAEELRGSATPGVTLTHLPDSWQEPGFTSWFEQWEHIGNRDAQVPWYLGLLHLDVGWLRDDETHTARLESWSPYDYNTRTLLDVDWRGLRVAGAQHWLRIDDLRVTPVGTGDTGAAVLPRLGSHYNDDTSPNDRFFVRRYGGGGELRLRPDGFGIDAAPLSQLSFYGSSERRTGQRQDRFLLEADEVGSGPATARFRGLTGDLDQQVTTAGARLVAEPAGLVTGLFDVSWQGFHNRASTLLVGDLGALDPAVRPAPAAAERALFFLPDTNRWTGKAQLSRRFGEATVQGGAFATRLAQTGTRTPLERAANLDDNHVTTVSGQSSANLPLTDWLSFDAYGKFALRDNGLERGTALFAADNRTQVGPFLHELREWHGGAELTALPAPGARAAVGWRIADVHRELDYADAVAADGLPQVSIQPPFSLIDDTTRTYTVYLRSHARLLRRLRIAGEAGIEWAPQIGLPTDLSHARYARLRVSHGWARPVPLTASLFGHLLDGESDGIPVDSDVPGASQVKDYERRLADWGATLAATPAEGLSLYATFTQQRDRQRFPHVRSNVPRFNGAPFLRFYVDSELGWRSDVQMLVVGGTRQINEQVDVSLSGWVTWANADFPRGGSTAQVLETVNEIDLTIASLEAAVGVQLRPDLRVGLAYRTDSYHDGARLDSPDIDGRDHAVTLSATWDFALFGE